MRHTMAVGTAAAALAGLVGVVGPQAAADSTVTVAGTAFPAGGTYLTYFGCVDLYHADTRGPEVRVYRDEATPAGRRSTDLRMPGAGTASGPVSLVTSVAQATSTLAVKAPSGASGVAWVWFASADLGPGQVWAGRADLQAAAGGWQQVAADAATYTWTRYDAATGTVVEQAGSATIDGFTAAHGDGPGYLLAGFGCDGHDFAVDQVRVGLPGAVTTYDLEGIAVTTTISASRTQVRAGQKVVLTGATTDARQRLMGATLVLQQRPVGRGSFTDVQTVTAGPDGRPVAAVQPQASTDYRWAFPETAYADAGYSPVVRVTVGGRTAR